MRRKVVGAGLVLALLTVALVLTTAGAAKPEQDPFKVAFIYPGPHNDDGWSQSHDTGPPHVREAVRQQGRDDLQGEHLLDRPAPAGGREARARGLRHDLRLLVRHLRERRERPALREVPGRALRAGDGHDRSEEPVPVLRRGRGHDLSLRAWRQARRPRRAIGYVVPFGIPEVVPARNAFALGAQATNPRRRSSCCGRTRGSRREGEGCRQNLISAGVDVLGQNVDSPAAGSSPSRRAFRGWGTTRMRGSPRRSSG